MFPNILESENWGLSPNLGSFWSLFLQIRFSTSISFPSPGITQTLSHRSLNTCSILFNLFVSYILFLYWELLSSHLFPEYFCLSMEHSYNGCFKVFFSNSNTWVIVELASIHYLFFWELVTFFWFFVYWVILIVSWNVEYYVVKYQVVLKYPVECLFCLFVLASS